MSELMINLYDSLNRDGQDTQQTKKAWAALREHSETLVGDKFKADEIQHLALTASHNERMDAFHLGFNAAVSLIIGGLIR
jgi:hypothetical protein